MHEVSMRIFTFCIILSCFISQSEAKCSQNTSVEYRFGSQCGFICHCVINEQCDVDTGECPSGCDFEWVGPGCQYKNIAVNSTGTYERQLDNVHPGLWPQLANDRNLSTCSHTGDENRLRVVNPWWLVWLPYNFTLRQMEILTIDSKRKYFDGFKVIVKYAPEDKKWDYFSDDQSDACYTHGNIALESVSKTVTCEKIHSGNQIIIQLGRKNTQLVLCDVRIYGDCAENVCGDKCDKLCYCKDNTAYKKVSGICSNGCKGRWSGKDGACDIECANDKWGESCDTKCGQCRNDTPCDVVTGKCPSGCKDGYKDTEMCDIVCPFGYYGHGCKETCSTNCAGGQGNCDKAYGTCLAGCNPGWTGRTCEEVCRNGRWGLNCANLCINCRQASTTCRNTDGLCLSGCIAGLKDTPFCDEECEEGTYGINCQQTCNENCKATCNKTDGHCEKCKAGWQGHTCSKECSEGSWGENCLIICGKCMSGSCDRYNGVCRGSCQPGYKPTLYCYEECETGWYGNNCTGKCDPDCKDLSLCRKSDGVCLTEPTGATTEVIAGVGAGLIVVNIFGILAILWYLKRTRSGNNVEKNANSAKTEVAMSEISTDGTTDEHHYDIPVETTVT